MLKRLVLIAALLSAAGVMATAQGPRRVALGDWPEARGPHRDGRSDEKGLIEKWALNGQNFLWRAPYGGRSAPVVLGNRVYVQNPAGAGDQMQERVMALDADTGNLYVMGVGAHVLALSKDGKLLWDRSVGEEFAAFTTHGGRTTSPIIVGDCLLYTSPSPRDS